MNQFMSDLSASDKLALEDNRLVNIVSKSSPLPKLITVNLSALISNGNLSSFSYDGTSSPQVA